MENSKIEWTHHTCNVWWGCRKVSPGCKYCYACALDARYHKGAHWVTDERLIRTDKALAELRRLNKRAGTIGVRERVFIGSMMDILEDLPQLAEPRQRVFDVAPTLENLDLLFLTKRPENHRFFPWTEWPANCWFGITGENQQHLNDRMYSVGEHGYALGRERVFVSAEPLLEPLSFAALGDSLRPHWVIVGGESGHGARPCRIEWIGSIVQQCRDLGIAPFVKQLGQVPAMSDTAGLVPLSLADRKGGDMAEWPESLRVREFPGFGPYWDER